MATRHCHGCRPGGNCAPGSRGFTCPKHHFRPLMPVGTSGARLWIRIRFHRSRQCRTGCRHSLGEAPLRVADLQPSNRNCEWQGRIRTVQPGMHGWQRGHGRSLGRGRQHGHAGPVRYIGLDKPVPMANASAPTGTLGRSPDREFDHRARVSPRFRDILLRCVRTGPAAELQPVCPPQFLFLHVP